MFNPGSKLLSKFWSFIRTYGHTPELDRQSRWSSAEQVIAYTHVSKALDRLVSDRSGPIFSVLVRRMTEWSSDDTTRRAWEVGGPDNDVSERSWIRVLTVQEICHAPRPIPAHFVHNPVHDRLYCWSRRWSNHWDWSLDWRRRWCSGRLWRRGRCGNRGSRRRGRRLRARGEREERQDKERKISQGCLSHQEWRGIAYVGRATSRRCACPHPLPLQLRRRSRRGFAMPATELPHDTCAFPRHSRAGGNPGIGPPTSRR